MYNSIFYITFVALKLFFDDMKRSVFFLFYVFFTTAAYAVTYSGTLPVLFIETENHAPIVSKDNYLDATYYLDAMGVEGVANIGSADSPLLMEIRGRGNYTWKDFDKKPYRIKLADKQPLLGMTKSKHFALLAHADDSRGFMRNTVGFQLSRMLGMAWTSNDKPLEVVLNGEYIGLYFLTETIRVDEERVNIVEQEDEETDSKKITGGWLVEIDNYDADPHITIEEGDGHSIWFTYKSPEVLSYEQETFLTLEMKRINALVYGDKNSEELWKYLDIDALARFYIVQELMDNYESFHGSCYLYRDLGEGQKWKFGPVWDFGSSFNRSKSQYIYEGDVWHNHWIPEICKFPVFIDYLQKIWNTFYAEDYNNIYAYIAKRANEISCAVAADLERWPQYGNKDFGDRVQKVNNRLRESASWLNKQWGSDNNPDDSDLPNNPEYDPEDDIITSMYIWQNGKKIEYDVAEVDSVTFVEKEKGIVVKAKVPNTWEKTIYVWIWGDDIVVNEYVAMKQGDWYVFSYEGEELNIIFKNGEGWTGHENQTVDIYTTHSACYQLVFDVEDEDEDKAIAIEVDCQ